jgi:hypothetical protein
MQEQQQEGVESLRVKRNKWVRKGDRVVARGVPFTVVYIDERLNGVILEGDNLVSEKRYRTGQKFMARGVEYVSLGVNGKYLSARVMRDAT